MTKKEKLLNRLLRKPKDFKWHELVVLLEGFGYQKIEKTKRGARVKFYLKSPRNIISIHKPHPDSTLKMYQINDVINNLKQIGIINGNN